MSGESISIPMPSKKVIYIVMSLMGVGGTGYGATFIDFLKCDHTDIYARIEGLEIDLSANEKDITSVLVENARLNGLIQGLIQGSKR